MVNAVAKYQKYAEYKDSGVGFLGSVPSHWDIASVRRFLVDHRQGYYTTESYVDDGLKLLRITDLRGLGEIDIQDCPMVKESDTTDLFKLKKGDVVFARTGGAGSFGAITKNYEDLIYASYLIRFRFISAMLEPNYLRFLFLSTSFQMSVKKNIHGGVNQNIHAEDIKDTLICVPSLLEQSQISEFLDYETAKINNLIEKQQKLIELLKEKRQAVISHAVTKGLNPNVLLKDSGVEWLGQVPEHWDIWKFSHIAPIITCGVASTPTYVDESEGMPFLSAQNIKNNKLSLHKFNYIPYSLHEQLTKYRRPALGDILVTRVGAGIGEACIVDIDLEFSIYVSLTHIRVKPHIAHNKFIMYFFGTDYCKFLNFEGTVTGGGVGNLNVNNVEKYKIALPSVREQQEIVDYLDSYIDKQNKLIAKAESAIQLMQERRTALISFAVTGKIDVRNWQNPDLNKNNNNEAYTELSQ